ncbi:MULTISPECIES: DUF5134 domain-containing protein [unclassified Gordonia (in: high G+C Gram-positive bacteria)]
MIENLLLRWVVTILFALAAAQCVYAIARQRMTWPGYVGHILHFIMSVAMLVMAWPFSMSWPTTGPAIFFGIAALWFLVSMAIPASARGHDCGCGEICTCGANCGCVPPTDSVYGRGVAVYHALMMAAMSWMYVVMNGTLLPGGDQGMTMGAGATRVFLALGDQTLGSGRLLLAHDHGDDATMPGMDMDMGHATQPGYVTPINWIITIGFAVAAVVWLYRFFERRRRAGNPANVMAFSGYLCQVFMAAGMAIMFGVML